jgi:hypothetical protein
MEHVEGQCQSRVERGCKDALAESSSPRGVCSLPRRASLLSPLIVGLLGIAGRVPMLTRTVLVTAATVLAVGVLAPVASGAQAESTILFRDGQPISVQAGQSKQTRTVVLCNSSASSARRLTWSLVGFEFTKGVKAVGTEDVISLEGARSQLAAGDCGASKIAVSATPGIGAGPFAGQLVVTSAGGGTARASISVAGPASAVVPTQGAAATIELTATQWVPFVDKVSIDGEGSLALRAPPKGKSLEVAPPGAFIGDLVNGPHIASVFVTGNPDKKDSEGVWLLPIRVHGANHPGEYEGALTPTASSAEDQTVKTKITVTDFWLWAVFAVVLGAGVVVLPTLYVRRWRLEGTLHNRHRALPGRYAAADAEFHRRFPQLDDIRVPSQTGVARYAAEADSAIRAYAESTWYFDTTSDAYAKIVESLDAAEADVECLEGGGLGEALGKLDAALTRLAEDLSKHLPIDRQPAIALVASALLQPGQLAVGEATIRAQKAKQAIATIAQWAELAQNLSRYEAWYRVLEEECVPSASGYAEEDFAALKKIYAEIGEARNELLEVADAAAIAKLGIPERLTAIYGQLAVLGAGHKVWVVSEPPPAGSNDAWPRLMLEKGGVSSDISTAVRVSVAAIQAQLPATVSDSQSWRQNADVLVISAAKTVELGKIKRFIGDTMVLVLSVATGVVASLSAFYFGKTFGTWEDYVTVIFVGTAAQAFLKPITDTLAQLRGSTEPVTKSDPKQAVATTVAQAAS